MKRKAPPTTEEIIALVERTAAELREKHPEWTLDVCRALLLCLSDRWGIGKAKHALRAEGVHAALQFACEKNSELRHLLADRDDTKRVQAQRILKGPSLLTITNSRSPEHAPALNGLLAAAIHPKYGIEGYTVADRIPLTLPSSLQPTLPTLPVRVEPCREINALLQEIFAEMGQRTEPPTAVGRFVRLHGLDTAEGQTRFGLPAAWDEARHGYESVIPVVAEGDVLMWNAWHATGGAAASQRGAKLVAFLDLVPKSYLGGDLYRWYEYVTQHAPMDPGAGSSRGAWLSLVAMLKDGRTADLGLSTEGWGKVGQSILTDEQKASLRQRGFLVVKPPDELRGLAAQSKAAFERFFRAISDYPLDLDAVDGSGSITQMFEHGLAVTGSTMVDPERPFALDGLAKSRNAQGGGAIITKSVGMGAGTTYCNEPAHVAFQLSQFAADVMASAGEPFYAGEPLIPVWERFRLKDQAAWSKATHVDTRIDNLIPRAAKEHFEAKDSF